MTAQPQSSRPGSSRGLLITLLVIPLLITLTGTVEIAKLYLPSLFQLSNLVGPTAESLLHGGGLTACGNTMSAPDNPICFHAARMPMASFVIASGVRLFGDHPRPVNLYKSVIFLIPIELCIILVWRRLPASPGRRLAIALLLLCPFAMLPFLINVINLQVEEGYFYSWLALAVGILLFTFPGDLSPTARLVRAFLFTIAIDAVYLSKSAMVVAVFVLAVAFLIREKRFAPRLLLALLALAAPVGWAIHQHHAAGRYTFGTSVDGLNFRKGNNDHFLERYPPQPGHTLDEYDPELFRNHSFPDEWTYNDLFQHDAVAWIRTHPAATFRAELVKLNVIFFSMHKIGAGSEGGTLGRVDAIGILLFRLIFWAAVVGAILSLIRRRDAPSAIIFLAVVAAGILPYILGFAYTRHLSILIYPSALFCCHMLLGDSAYNGDLRNSRLRNESA